MANKQFSLAVREWVEQTKGDLEKTFQAFVMQMGTRLITMSPVDTGRFRGNWRVSVNGQDLTTDVEEFDPAGNEAISRLGRVTGRAKIGDVVWVTNNLEYALQLEYGWSAQAPSGMVRVTALELNLFLKQAMSGGS